MAAHGPIESHFRLKLSVFINRKRHSFKLPNIMVIQLNLVKYNLMESCMFEGEVRVQKRLRGCQKQSWHSPKHVPLLYLYTR